MAHDKKNRQVKSRVLAMVEGNPVVKQIHDDGRAIEDEFNSRREFVKKQVETINKEFDERQKAFWQNAEVALRKAGLLPLDYDPSKGHHLTFDPGASAILVCYWHDEFPGIAFELPL